MPHRGPRASLRQAIGKGQAENVEVVESQASSFRTMSAMQMLKHGLNGNLWKKKGWLWELLKAEGLADGSKQNKKNNAGAITRAKCSTSRRFKKPKMMWNMIPAGTTTK
jgi:hypothetical protein